MLSKAAAEELNQLLDPKRGEEAEAEVVETKAEAKPKAKKEAKPKAEKKKKLRLKKRLKIM